MKKIEKNNVGSFFIKRFGFEDVKVLSQTILYSLLCPACQGNQQYEIPQNILEQADHLTLICLKVFIQDREKLNHGLG